MMFSTMSRVGSADMGEIYEEIHGCLLLWIKLSGRFLVQVSEFVSVGAIWVRCIFV